MSGARNAVDDGWLMTWAESGAAGASYAASPLLHAALCGCRIGHCGVAEGISVEGVAKNK